VSKQIYPEPTVGALIFNPQDEFLLVQSHKWRNRFVIPGGHIEMGETMETALRRETKEETGLEIFDIRFISFQEFILDNSFYEERHFIFFDFSCKTNSSIVTLDSESERFIWAKRDDLDKLDIEPYTRRTINTYFGSMK
jgi:nucleoside triphosphatase